MSLRPIPFRELVLRMKNEVEASEAIFDLPVRKWFIPDEEYDYSALHFGRKASTPLGPAAGPQTQMAQNIVLSWLAGARIIELKTVQVNDELDIPRPCIHAPNVGLNVEWSQELRVEESIDEYAKAAYLIEILKHTRCFGRFKSDAGMDTVYDTSVGYDLAGIKSEKVTGFLKDLQSSAHLFDRLRDELGGDLSEFRELEIPDTISDCVTLSTFHGCPAHEIESITRYLIEDLKFDAIIKLNPTLLGFERVSELLVEKMGYTGYRLQRDAFDADLEYGDALNILRSLKSVAEANNSTIGAKFTNTLVVANDPDVFPTQSDPYMYVSGPPLHVISMNLMQMVREDLDFDIPVSFSAGIDAQNFASAVSCGMVPITTCTDLLRQGGYGRLPAYLRSLRKEMDKLGVKSREAYVLSVGGHALDAVQETLLVATGDELQKTPIERLRQGASDDAGGFPSLVRAIATELGLDGERIATVAARVAGRMNGHDQIPSLEENPRYHWRKNNKEPRRLDSELDLYDCINCDICITVCPNDAFFSYEVAVGDGIAEEHQLVLLDDLCNYCSNCEVYCPENGAPFEVKERVFSTREGFEKSALDGFWSDGVKVLGRVGGELVGDEATADPAAWSRLMLVQKTIFESGQPNPVNPAGALR